MRAVERIAQPLDRRAGVQIGAGTSIGPHCVIESGTRIGRDNRIWQFCSIGAAPQDKKYAGEPTLLEIGGGTLEAHQKNITRI